MKLTLETVKHKNKHKKVMGKFDA